MSAALDRAFADIDRAAWRRTIDAVKQGARRYARGEQSMRAVLPTIDALPPEDVLPALIERREGERARFAAGHWTASSSRVIAARSAVLAVRWMRRFPESVLALREGRIAA